MIIFLIPSVFCHPSVAPAVVDTPEMCLNLNCMANLLPKASDPEGQRTCVRIENRTSSPVSIAPQKRTFSPWSVPPQSPGCVLPVACPQCQSTPTSLSRSLTPVCLPLRNSPPVEEQQLQFTWSSHTWTVRPHNVETHRPPRPYLFVAHSVKTEEKRYRRFKIPVPLNCIP